MSQDRRKGIITNDGDTATVRFERRLPYSIDEVWAAIVEPKEREGWFGTTTIDPKVGGEIVMDPQGPGVPDDMKRMTGRILAWEPPRLFEHEWRQRIIGDTVVRYELVPDGDGTLLRFSHSRLTEKNARGFIPGTHAYLDRLEAHLAKATIPDWWQRFQELAPSYAG